MVGSERNGKCVVDISSSSEGELCQQTSGSDDETDYSFEGSRASSSSGSDWSIQDGDDEEESDQEDEEEFDQEDDDRDDDESRYNKVIRLLQEGSYLECLDLKECKAYLRQHCLRITGTKEICIQRIKEHWRIKDGNGAALYPRSSFVINCTGDVCKGDVVLFTQKVYEKFDKKTRSGKPLGKRTIVGRVVKESYGAAKQQHTFTVEVLWSKGFKQLPPLFPLLVKGRNLYKMRTFRQLWNNEAERSRVLAEKHERGAAARMVRAAKKRKTVGFTNRGTKRQKRKSSPRTERRLKTKDGVGRRRKPSRATNARQSTRQKANPFGQAKSRETQSSQRPQHHTQYGDGGGHLAFQFNNFHQSQVESLHGNAPFRFTSYDAGSPSTFNWLPPPIRPYCDSSLRFPPFRPYGDLHRTGGSLIRGFGNNNYYDRAHYLGPKGDIRHPGRSYCWPHNRGCW